jgi:RNase H-fold protein (predicted Holliday junction resolvase)
MNTTILALDLGTTTGWAVQSADGSITSGTQQFKPQRFEGGGISKPCKTACTRFVSKK